MAETRSIYFGLPRYDVDTDGALSRTDWEEAVTNLESRAAYDDGAVSAALPLTNLKPGRYARQTVTDGFALYRRSAAAWEWVGGPVMPVRRYHRGVASGDIVWSTDVAAGAATATMTAGGELATSGAVRALQGAVGADLGVALDPLTTGRLYARTRAISERAVVASAHAGDAGNLYTALESGGQAIWTVDAAGRMQARLANGFGAAPPVTGVPLSSAAIVGTAGAGARLHGSTTAPVSPGLEVLRNLSDAAPIFTAMPDHVTIGRTPWIGGQVSLVAPTIASAGTFTHIGTLSTTSLAATELLTGWGGGRVALSVDDLADILAPVAGDLAVLTTDNMLYRYTGAAWLGVLHLDIEGHAKYKNVATQSIPSNTLRKLYLPTAVDTTTDVTLTAGTTSTGSYLTLNRGGLWTVDAGVLYGFGAGTTFRGLSLSDDVHTTTWKGNSGYSTISALSLDVSTTRRFPVGQRIAAWVYHEVGAPIDANFDGESTSLAATWRGP
jgi:hypothetical protein